MVGNILSGMVNMESRRYAKYNLSAGGKRTRENVLQRLEKLGHEIDTQVLTPEIVDEAQVLFQDAVKYYYNVEEMHLLEDKIMIVFINQLSRNLIPVNEISKIASKISAINSEKYHKWYS